MIKIVFLNDWGESSSSLLERYSKQTPGNSGSWKNISGTDELKKADFYIVLDGVPDSIKFDRNRAVFVKREPDYIKSTHPQGYANIIDWDETNCGITWWLSKSYDELKESNYPKKTKGASCVASSKHKHRNRFIKSLYPNRKWRPWKQNVQMDLFGRGHSRKYYGENYKGSIDSVGNCKMQGLESYKYSLVLENSEQKNYWTEKLADAYLAWCVPIYWGCPNLEDFFDSKSYFRIGLDTPVEEFNEIINQPIDHNMIDLLTEAREKILDEFNIWEVIRKKIETGVL